jgi:DNA-binding CsgD family transcriptional regulator
LAKSAALRLCDLRAAYRLVGECRDLGDDPTGWRIHLGAGVARLTGAGWSLVAEMEACVRGPRRDLGTAVWGWENGFNQAAWIRVLTGFQRDPLYNPLMNAYIDRLSGDGGRCLSRGEMIPDREWYPTAYYQEGHRHVGADATLTCFHRISGTDDEFAEIFVARRVGERDFSARDRAIVLEAAAAIAPLVGGTLARFGDVTPAGLSRRTREVLRCLLEGDSDKQIAARLRISRFTVNVHTKAIFAHFGVGGRAELLAIWVRRGWGGRFSWLV